MSETWFMVFLGAAMVGSFALAALRIQGEKSKSFQAVAHLWVGLLIGFWLAMVFDGTAAARVYAVAVPWVALCIIEVACFLRGI